MKTTSAILLSIIAFSGCAQRPDAIAPVSMAGAFDGISCQKASELLNVERVNLAALSKQQNDAATGDAIGVFLIGVPMSSVGGGDKAGNIATSKGKIVAFENRLQRCR